MYERLYLELLLITEKDKIDEYVKYAKYHMLNCDYTITGLRNAFLWTNTSEGYEFWRNIENEAINLMRNS